MIQRLNLLTSFNRPFCYTYIVELGGNSAEFINFVRILIIIVLNLFEY